MNKINHLKARVLIELNRLGWTMTDLAGKLGYSKQYLSWILNSESITTKAKKDIRDVLGLPLEGHLQVSATYFGVCFIPRFKK